jgi:hypothetical protein
MQFPNMLIDSGSSLRAAVALRVVEIKRVDSKVADGAFKRDASVQRLGGVIAHTLL